jgi:integrase/recombinase XerD
VSRLVHYRPRSEGQKRLQALVLLLLDTGLRIEEALTLGRNQIDLDNLLLKAAGKGNKERVVPISSELRKVLWRHLQRQSHDLVFSTQRGGRLTQRNVLRDLKGLCADLDITGVRCSPHTLRHTFAVAYLRNGGNLFYLSRILGHSSVTTTQRYLESLGVEDLQAVHNRFSVVGRG